MTAETYNSVFHFFVGRFHPVILICFVRDKVNSSGGVFLVIVDPAPIVEPLAIFTGAINCVSEPINTLSSIIVWNLFAPS
jgi:hypothetical protein